MWGNAELFAYSLYCLSAIEIGGTLVFLTLPLLLMFFHQIIMKNVLLLLAINAHNHMILNSLDKLSLFHFVHIVNIMTLISCNEVPWDTQYRRTLMREYLSQGKIIAFDSILCDAITSPCLTYWLLAPKSLYVTYLCVTICIWCFVGLYFYWFQVETVYVNTVLFAEEFNLCFGISLGYEYKFTDYRLFFFIF